MRYQKAAKQDARPKLSRRPTRYDSACFTGIEIGRKQIGVMVEVVTQDLTLVIIARQELPERDASKFVRITLETLENLAQAPLDRRKHIFSHGDNSLQICVDVRDVAGGALQF